jgi:hypothetical protein
MKGAATAVDVPFDCDKLQPMLNAFVLIDLQALASVLWAQGAAWACRSSGRFNMITTTTNAAT